MSQAKQRVLSIVFSLLIGVVFCGSAHADIAVSLTANPSAVSLSESLVLDIEIINPDQIPIKSWMLDLSFDPGVFDATGFALGSYITGVVPQANLGFEDDGLSPDIARVSALNFGGTTGDALSGLLGQITLLGVGEGMDSPLIITGDLLDAQGVPLGNVTFIGTFASVMPEPATLCLLGGAMLTVIARRPSARRRR